MRWRRANSKQRMGRDLLCERRPSGCGVGTVIWYRWVAARRAEGLPTAVSCRVAGVSRQAFHDLSSSPQGGALPI